MKTDPPVSVRRLYPDDWAAFREIRLRALADAPTAFSSTLKEALTLNESTWRERLALRAQFLAEAGGRALGTAAGFEKDSRPELISMWVEPRSRGYGVGDRLVKAVLHWARLNGNSSVSLWVVEGNLFAERLYLRHGFKRTGRRQPLDAAREGRHEFEMSVSLGGATS